MHKKPNFLSVFLNGLIVENPTFVLMLGMCPTLGITTMAMNGVGMGLATTFVLVFSNLFISVQFSSVRRVRFFATPQTQHARIPCPSPAPRAY